MFHASSPNVAGAAGAGSSTKSFNRSVVERKLCSIATPATHLLSDDLLSVQWSGGSPTPEGAASAQRLLVALSQRVVAVPSHAVTMHGGPAAGPVFGVTILDATLGRVEVLEFQDDAVCSRLKSVLRQARPVELIVDSVVDRTSCVGR